MAIAQLLTPQELQAKARAIASAVKTLHSSVTTASGAVIGGPAPVTPPVSPPTTGG